MKITAYARVRGMSLWPDRGARNPARGADERGCLGINADVAPYCRFKFKTMFVQLASVRPMALIQEGTYIKDFPGYVIYVTRKGELDRRRDALPARREQ